ncbi:MAG: hypothetical protein LBD64_02780 [Odoribacteraceae bacterium]|jgi:hypothetical protein|nr:hypothetical protein [Odoribacteraceae bacterium]
METLTGKWTYNEEYEHGTSTGELLLQQAGARLSGKIILSDRPREGDSCMIQEELSGKIEGKKIKLKAITFDVIHSEQPLEYALDEWFGILVDEQTIIGTSVDARGVEGNFVFKKT